MACRRYYYTRDHLGSVRELCNSSGSIVARYSYDPYGRTTLVSGSNLATKQYAGMYAHQPSGLYFTKYRAFDPNTGRWFGRDPIAEKGGINLYDYVGNDPSNETDPQGKYAIPRPPVIVVNPWAGAVLSGLLVGEVINALGESTGLYNYLAHKYVESGQDPFHLNPNPKNPVPPAPAPSPQTNPTKPNTPPQVAPK